MNHRDIPNIPSKSIPMFWSKVSGHLSDACWNWTGAKTKKGYGKFGSYLAHRVSFFMATNIQPKSFQVCHSCDNPSCVNPGHLFLGTQIDNERDKANKGRNKWKLDHPQRINPERRARGATHGRYTKPECTPRGDNHWRSKITAAEVLIIRESTISRKELAEKYGICRQSVDDIINRKSWAHI